MKDVEILRRAINALADYLLDHREWLPEEERLWEVLGAMSEMDLRLRGADPDKARIGAGVVLSVLREQRR